MLLVAYVTSAAMMVARKFVDWLLLMLHKHCNKLNNIVTFMYTENAELLLLA